MNFSISQETRTNLKITVGIALSLVVAWYIFTPPALYGLLAASSIVLAVIFLIRRKIAKEVKVFNVTGPPTRDTTGTASPSISPGEYASSSGTQSEGIPGRDEGRGNLQSVFDKSATESELESGSNTQGDKEYSSDVPDLQ